MGRKTKINIAALWGVITLLCAGFAIPAAASYIPFNTNVNMNIGIGTETPQGAFVVANGNVGVGTWAPSAPLTVGANAFTVSSKGAIAASGGYTQSGSNVNTFGGNVGIGSLTPGQILDVNGTVRMTNFTMSGQTPISGYVLTASDSAGDSTWTSASAVSGWTVSGNNVYETLSGNVGIGTTAISQGALVVTNGNVGIGTWVPSAPLTVGANAFTVNSTGAITAVTGITTSGGYTQSGNNVNAFGGNVGIGSLTPGQILDVNGTVRMTNFTMSGQTPVSGYVLTASDSAGDSTWASASAVSGWTVAGNNVYETGGGNVGIGTTAISQGALVVTNGNVGIGTWVPSAPLTVGANAFTVNGTGAIATSGGYTQSGIGTNTLSGTTTFNALGTSVLVTGNVGVGSANPGQALDVTGTVRMTNFTMSGQTPISGYVLTASDSSGDTTWTSAGAVSGWTVSGNNVYETGSGNVGIGTTAISQGALVVTNGNVGIGTWVPSAPLTVGANAFTVNGTGAITTSGGYTQSGNGINAFTGNVGIGSANPGQALDVTGTIRTTAFAMSGQTPISGYVLTASDSSGDTTWTSGGAISGWTVSGNNVYEALSGNVGIGTTAVTQGALVVTNGNVGIGTWVPSAPLTVGANAFTVNGTGAIATSGGYTQSGIGTNTLSGTTTFNALGTSVLVTGNVGVGSANPGQALDVTGTVRMTNFTMSGQTPISGYVLTASDSSGDTTWTSGGAISGWTVSGNNVYEALSGNVGIGTTAISQGALVVTNGNVGIGTWAPSAPLTVGANAFTVNSTGAIAASGGYTQSGNGINAFTGNVGIGSAAPGQKLDVNGTVRTTAFAMSGQTPISGYVLTASDSAGDSTWTSAGAVSGWTVSGNNVYETAGGNVGIGSTNPGQSLDVNGTVRMAGLTLTNNGAASGNVLVSNAIGIGTWMPAGTLTTSSQWTTTNTTDVYLSSNGNVGIGTFLTSTAALTVMNGNVGIGTWVPSAPLTVGANAFTVNSTGAIAASGGYTQSGNGINAFTGNVGIGSAAPGQKLDVNGTVRTTAFAMSGQTPVTGYVLTASDSAGDTTWASASAVGGWSVSGNNVYETAGGNVGIGSTNPGQSLDVNGTVRMAGLTLTNNGAASGNVLVSNAIGIGTWMPAGTLTTSSQWTTTNTTDVYLSSNGNVGIGTFLTSTAALTVMNGNVGIGTWVPSAPLTVGANAFTVNSTGTIVTAGGYTQNGNGINAFTGNVGIGSAAPGQKLDVNGTVRTTAFAMSGQTPISGYVLTASDSAGDSTWTSAGAVSGWTVSGNNVYETAGGNVGIGTTVPGQALDVNGTLRAVSLTGAAGSTFNITSATGTNLSLIAGTGGGIYTGPLNFTDNGSTISRPALNELTFSTNSLPAITINPSQNVGIGSVNPGQILDVTGTVRMTNFTMSGQTPISGYVLTASDSAGDTTWTSAGSVSGWTVSGNNVYEALSGNVGIGTTFVNGAGEGALTVMNGNVGIGTWLPSAPLAVGANAFTVNSTGAIATSGGYTQSGTNVNAFGGNVGIGSLTPGQALDVNGTVRMTGLALTGNGAANGNVLVTNAIGIGTWMSPTTLVTSSQWTTTDVNDVYLPLSGNVGLGTFLTSTSALTVMNGNIGIGTWKPAGALDIKTGTNVLIENGNLGIGSLNPGQALDVKGTVRTTAFAMSGQTPISGYVLTASDSAGNTTWSSAPSVSGWTIVGNGVYESLGGNVGIGTTSLQTALAVTNGNVGIGTWAPNALLSVNGPAVIGAASGYVSGGYNPSNGLLVQGNVGVGTFDTTNYTFNVGGTEQIGGGYLSLGLPGVTLNGIALAQSASTLRLTNMNNIAGSLGVTVSGTGSNVGINTTQLSGGSVLVVNGGVSIGTSSNSTSYFTTAAPAGGMIVAGNVGIGSLTPGQALDVTGTVRTTAFAMSGQTPISGYVLTAIDSAGNTTWSSAPSVAGWTISGNNVYESLSGNVGIGTTFVNGAGEGALTVMNGNVGIGTWLPSAPLAVGANAFTVNSTGAIATSGGYTQSGNGINAFSGNVGIGSAAPGQRLDVTGTIRSIGGIVNGNVGIGTSALQTALAVTNGNVGIGTWTAVNPLSIVGGVSIGTTGMANTTAPANGLLVSGNVGIGSAAPGQALDVTGTVRTTAFAMSGQTPISGYVLTAIDSAGNTTWSSAPSVAGWTISGNNVYESLGGNVGIGTTSITQGALVVTNGNVGIGTWVPSAPLTIGANAFTVNSTGAIATSGGYTQSGNGINAFSGNVGIGSAAPGQRLDVQGTIRSIGGIVNGNVGIGTSALQIALAVTNGNVGIGTWTAVNPLSIVGGVSIGSMTFANTSAPANGLLVSGNVGIGSAAPGQALDVTGTVRTTAFTMSGQTPISGYVLTASDSAGDTTWTSAGAVSGWTVSGNNVYETLGGNVGIGTITEAGGSLIVKGGNVGIGSAWPGQLVDVQGTVRALYFVGDGSGITGISGAIGGLVSGYVPRASSSTTIVDGTMFDNGNIGIGSAVPGQLLDVQGTIRSLAGIINGNLGIGSAVPGQRLDVTGTVRTTFLTMSGQTPISGYVLTASDSAGDTTWTSGGAVSGWTVSGNNVYETYNGNVGIGTTLLTTSALTVMNGNVGIGTWLPQALLTVNGNSILGGVTGTVNSITSSGTYSLAGGRAYGSGTAAGIITSSGNGSIAFGNSNTANTVNPTSMISNADGSIAMGDIIFGGTLQATGNGSIAMGLVNLGTLTSSGPGSIAMGDASSTLQATGSGSVAIGTNVQAINNDNFALGENVINPLADSFMIGFNTNPTLTVTATGVGIGTWLPSGGLIVLPANSGNVGIGSLAPGQALDVNGTVRTKNFTMTGQTPISGYILTASDSAGDTTWTSGGAVSGWTVSGNNVYEALGGNVGIGTITEAGGSLIVKGGNVGIGSAWPGQLVDVQGTVRALFFVGNGTGITGINTGGWSQLGTNVYTVTGSNNVGIGTLTPQAGLAVTNGNVGIGTWTAASPLSIVGGVSIGTTGMANTTAPANGLLVSGNVGIGSAAPGQALDVTGTIRTTAFAMSGQTPISGYVLTASDSAGNTTWTSGGAISGWTISGNNVYEALSGNVGIGTTSVTQGALVVTNGNVGIGTWVPAGLFQINKPSASPFAVTSAGNVGIGTITPQGALTVTSGNVGIGTWTAVNPLSIVGGVSIGTTGMANTTAPANGLLVSGNVGIGSAAPGQALDVTGTVRTTAFAMSGQTPISGYVLTASDSAGNTTWSSAPSVAGWTISGNNVYESLSGNVGIGTTSVTQGALVVTNGNVGIGTWAPAGLFQINKPSASPFAVTSAGNVGIGTIAPQGAFTVTNGNVGIGTWAPAHLLDVYGPNGGNWAFFGDAGTSPAPGLLFGATGVDTGSQIQFIRDNGTSSLTISNSSGAGPNSIVSAADNLNITYNTNNLSRILTFINNAAEVARFDTNGNLGIGSTAPGQLLDVSGTVRTKAFAMSGQTPISGYVLTASDSAGNTTWSSAPSVAGWTISGNNVYESLSGNVGIGTTSVTQGALVVTNGNVGIGTWAPAGLFQINKPSASPFAVTSAGNVGIGTITPQSALSITNGNVGIGTWTAAGGNLIINGGGNVGIGSAWPGALLDVQGTVRALYFVGNGSGITGINSGGWVQSGTNVYTQTGSNNVGVGTTTPQGGFVVTNGNVGIGTWAPVKPLSVIGDTYLNGNIGIGTTFVGGAGEAALTVMNGNVGIGTWVPSSFSSILSINGSTLSTGSMVVSSSAAFTGFLVFNGTSGQQQANLSGNDGGNNGGTLYLSSGAALTTIISGSPNLPSYFNNGQNVGIATTAPASALSVAGGVGIGTGFNSTYVTTTAPKGGMIVQGNVGIGSLTPGQILDVTGTVRTTNFTMTGQTPISGYVLTASDSAGDTTWTSGGAVSGWTVSGKNVYETLSGNVGIGTTALQTAFAVTNGNVGIGTWTASNPLSIVGGVSIGTTGMANTTAPANGLLVSGNVGIGSAAPGQALDVNGTVRALFFVGNGAGITGINAGGWSQSGSNIYTTTGSNNVGIGTITPQGGLVVTNGNVGIGTWAPANKLEVVGGNIGIGTQYNLVGIGTTTAILSLQGDTTSIYLGWQAGANATGLSRGNTAVGNQALYFNTTGSGNSALGQGALYTNSVGTSNSAFGQNSLYSNTTGIQNTAMGLNALYTNSTGTANTAMGLSALVANTSGSNNVAMGVSALAAITTGGNNSALGVNAGNFITGGASNQTSGNSVYLGYQTEALQDGDTNEIVIGYQAVGIGANSVMLGNNLITKTQLQGNVGIGTFAPNGKLIVSGGNVGIGSLAPGQILDVTGTVRTTNFTMSGQTPISGYVLTASDSAGDTIWTSGEAVSGWTVSGNNVYEAFGGNVGIGTTSVTQGALIVTNGNVGIGTWVPNELLDIGTDHALTVDSSGDLAVGGFANFSDGFVSGSSATISGSLAIGTFPHPNPAAFGLYVSGNVGIGTSLSANSLDVATNVSIGTAYAGYKIAPTNGLAVQGNVGIGTWTAVNPLSVVGGVSIGTTGMANTPAPANGLLVSGNVGVGSAAPGQLVDVQGTVRALYFVGNGAGITGLNAGGWTQSGSNVYTTTGSNNVGIGTSTPQGGLVVTNGNVGIGTWAPVNALDVNGGSAFGSYAGKNAASGGGMIISGNVGIGTILAQGPLQVRTGADQNGFFQTNQNLANGVAFSAVNDRNTANVDLELRGSVVQLSSIGNNPVNILTNDSLNSQNTIRLIVDGSGNVSIGTTPFNAKLGIMGNIGIGTVGNGDNFLTTTPPNGGMIVESNVGIGSVNPGQKLDVQGTVRTTFFAMSGQTPISGYVLTSSDSAGNTTWTSGGAVSGWTVSGNNVYETLEGNVGIGTITEAGGNLIVNGGGNVGIGSAWPGQLLDVQGTARVSGNVGIGSSITDSSGTQRLTITPSTVEINLQ